mmetsp:Transcript_9068/g.11150  ORF Transcript_9068/g.11150 Transcript_9068/m.11150 type:complete len:666 (+) Transcript_9068:202-2199(+)|eukprot:CAMPEP_0172508824 /NCGR_PEP_ID=MMETSP1066-20121228/215167_1 /TAXON_ID=671091 /ORGANISM="Coscinodiscus wailesii, Strain CCMP2513" /LENGTH=665 /DNA_ID=CAMNT_0013287007 /DNA_START=202 /DNA_END=2199 /DNA_ORIENTATION=-
MTSTCGFTEFLCLGDNETDLLKKYDLPDLSTTVPTKETDFDKNPTPLYLSLLRKNFRAAQRIIITKTAPENPYAVPGYDQANTWTIKKDATTGDTILRTLPLHAAIGFGAPYDPLVDLLIHVSPLSVRSVDHDGRLPIHVAFASGAEECLINRLITIYPDCVAVRDNSGKLPHQCCGTEKVLPISVYAEMRADVERESVTKQVASERELELKNMREESESKIKEMKLGYEEKATAAAQEHEKNLNAMKAALDAMEESHRNQLSEARECKQQEIYKVVGNHAIEVAELNKKMMTEAENMKDTLRAARDAHERELNDLDEKHRANLNEIQQRHDAERAELSHQIEAQLAIVSQIKETTAATREEQDKKYKELEDGVANYLAESDELKHQITALENGIGELNRSLRDSEAVRDSISEKLSLAAAERDELRAVAKSLTDSTEQERQTYEKANKELATQIVELTERLETVTTERDGTKAKAVALEIHRDKLDENLKESEVIRRTIQKEIDVIVRERDEYDEQLKRAAEEKHKVQEMVTAAENDRSEKIKSLEEAMIMKQDEHSIELQIVLERKASLETDYKKKLYDAETRAVELEKKSLERISELESQLVEKKREYKEAMRKQKDKLELVTDGFKKSFCLEQHELDHYTRELRSNSSMDHSDAIEIFVAH